MCIRDSWDIHLRTDRPVAGNIRYVGIRSHDIRAAGGHSHDAMTKDSDKQQEQENCFTMELLDMVESPFEYKYHMKAAGRNAKEAIWWKAYKDLNPDAAPESFPRKMYLPKEKLLLMKE